LAASAYKYTAVASGGITFSTTMVVFQVVLASLLIFSLLASAINPSKSALPLADLADLESQILGSDEKPVLKNDAEKVLPNTKLTENATLIPLLGKYFSFYWLSTSNLILFVRKNNQ